MATIEEIKKELEKVKYPGFEKSIMDFGFVKDVQVEGNTASIVLDITSSAQEVEDQLRKDIHACINAIGLEVRLGFNKPQAPKQNSNSVSGKNIAPQIKKIVMVSSGKGGVGKSTRYLRC